MKLDKINADSHAFTGEELGELLLASVKQMQAGEQGKVHQVAVSEAIKARHSVGMSQREFAQAIGVSVRTLQGWEQGRRKPSGAAATLLRIATNHPETIQQLHK